MNSDELKTKTTEDLLSIWNFSKKKYEEELNKLESLLQILSNRYQFLVDVSTELTNRGIEEAKHEWLEEPKKTF